MKHKPLGVLISIILSLFFFSPLQAATKPSINIGIVLDGPWGRFQENVETFKQEIIELTEAEFDVAFPDAILVDGQWNVAGINQAIDSLLANKDTDLIITLGHVASNEIAKRRDLSKPVIAAFLIDAGLQGLPVTEGGSGIKNLAYVDRMQRLDREIASFQDITPIRHLAIFVDSNIVETIPQIVQATEDMVSQKELKLSVVSVGTSATEALQKLDEDIDGVLTTPLFRITDDDFQNFVNGLIQQQLPSYSYIGLKEVEKGMFATFSHESSTIHLARTIALVVHDILRGEKPEKIQVSFAVDKQLSGF
jgi:ABC-type uncharacterized transport system substrate-binding protein